jgi:hypothetical protein
LVFLRVKANPFKVIKMAGTGGPPHHPFDLENAKLPGVTHWLDQIFDAPPLVKAAMIDLSSLDRCMVGTQKTESNITQCLRVGVCQF